MLGVSSASSFLLCQMCCEDHWGDGLVLPCWHNQAFCQPPNSTRPHLHHRQLQPTGACPPQSPAAVLVGIWLISVNREREKDIDMTLKRFVEQLYVEMCAIKYFSSLSDSTIDRVDTREFWVNMPNLMSHLKKVAEQKPQATYYNVDMIKYQVLNISLSVCLQLFLSIHLYCCLVIPCLRCQQTGSSPLL